MAQKIDDFAAFILSHGRPDKVFTYNALRRAGYSGPVYILIDNEDATAPRYVHNFGEQVIVFDKAAVAQTFDEGDNFADRRAVIYARNACFEIARQRGVTYFLELDDDYTLFSHKTYSRFGTLLDHPIRNLDAILAAMLRYYRSIPAVSIAMAQTGDFLGGGGNKISTSITQRRKAMNTFLCSTERPFQFVGRINEDVNTYTWYQSLGHLFLTLPMLAIHQTQTQANSGGMTELYLDSGTYVKSFYTVMYCPSSVKVELMHSKFPRLHHKIQWAHTVPCILSEQYRKASTPFLRGSSRNGVNV